MSSKVLTRPPFTKGSAASAKQPSKPQQVDFSSIDARLKRINDNIWSRSPYILTVPSERPYRINSYQVNEWRRGSPFAPEEEQLQYLSFLARDRDDGLLCAVGNWDNDEGGIMDTKASQAARSSTGTPQQGPRKKIKLSEYKSHKAGQLGVKEPATTDNESKVDGPTNGVSAPVENSSAKADQPHQGTKRPLSATMSADPSKTSDVQDHTPPAKKSRSSPSPAIASKKPDPPKTKPLLPPLLSPNLPPKIEKGLTDVRDTPALVNGDRNHKKTTSITSTASDQKVLSRVGSPSGIARDGKGSQKEASGALTTKTTVSNVQAHGQMNDYSSKHLEPPKRTSQIKNMKGSSNADSKPTKMNKITGVDVRQATASIARKGPVEKSNPSQVSSKADLPKKIVVFKIPRSLRKDVSRILGMQPRPKKLNSTTTSTQHSLDPAPRDKGLESDKVRQSEKDNRKFEKGPPSDFNNGHDRKVHSAQNKPPAKVKEGASQRPNQIEKRRLPGEDYKETVEPPHKRQKSFPNTLDLTKKARTPTPAPFKSPILSQAKGSPKSRTHFTTPTNKDLKAIKMSHLSSNEADAPTPDSTDNAPPSNRLSSHTSRSSNDNSISDSSTDHVNSTTIENPNLNTTENPGLDSTENSNLDTTGNTTLSTTQTTTVDTTANADLDTTENTNPDITENSGLDTTDSVNPADLSSSNVPETSQVISMTPEEEFRLWRSDHTKYVELGRTLKHEADRYLGRMNPAVLISPEAKMKGIALAIESILAWMLAFTANDEASRVGRQSRDSGGWSTLPAYVYFVKRCINEQFLHGLIYCLEALIRDAMDKIDRENDNSPLRSHYSSLPAADLWEMGVDRLPIKTLISEFPVAWAAAALKPVRKEKLVPGNLGGSYYLPLSRDATSVISGIRAGYAILNEWCDKEGVEWKGRLGL